MTILSNGHQWKYTEFTDNKGYSFNKKEILSSLTSEEIDDAYNSICKWKGYSPTPLLSLNKLSSELNLNKIWCEVYSNNSALEIYRKIGFVDEGVLRQNHFKDGEYVDSYVLSMLRSEWADGASKE